MHTHIKVCKNFQKNKEKNFKYGKLSAKEAEDIPWDRSLEDIIIPYKIRREGHDNPPIIKSSTMIYLETGWCEIIQYEDKHESTIEKIVEQTWLCRYTRPTIIMYDREN